MTDLGIAQRGHVYDMCNRTLKASRQPCETLYRESTTNTEISLLTIFSVQSRKRKLSEDGPRFSPFNSSRASSLSAQSDASSDTRDQHDAYNCVLQVSDGFIRMIPVRMPLPSHCCFITWSSTLSDIAYLGLVANSLSLDASEHHHERPTYPVDEGDLVAHPIQCRRKQDTIAICARLTRN